MAAEPAVAQECVEGYLFVRDPLRVLLLRRPPRRGRIWVPVSGKIDPSDPTPPDALVREIREETGVASGGSPLPLDWQVTFDGPDGRPWRLTAFAVELAEPAEPTLSAEHDAFAWLAPSEARDRLYHSDNRAALDRLVEQVARFPRPKSPGETPRAVVVPRWGEALFARVRAGHHRKLALQAPAGLTRNAHDLAASLRDAVGVPVVVVARACFGACDFPSPSETPGVDGLVVLGHAPIPNVPLDRPTYFVEMRESGGDPERLAGVVEAAGVPRRLGLVASVQHLDLVPALTDALARRGYVVEIGRGDRRLADAAQALGCNYTGAEAIAGDVEAFLFVGTGRFHPLGLAQTVTAPVWSVDPLVGVVEPPIDRGALVRRRQLLVAKCRDARRWGVIVSTFAGQNRTGTALALQRRARGRGLEAELFVADRIDPNDLLGRDVDAYVNTACPRIALDDAELYAKPILTVPEFLMAIGEAPLEPYRFDTYH